jgi:hypothetical protein
MSRTCSYDHLAADLAFFDGVVLEEPLEPCLEPATHEVLVARGAPGDYQRQLHTPLCLGHEAVVGLAAGWQRSIKLRSTT